MFRRLDQQIVLRHSAKGADEVSRPIDLKVASYRLLQSLAIGIGPFKAPILPNELIFSGLAGGTYTARKQADHLAPGRTNWKTNKKSSRARLGRVYSQAQLLVGF